MTIDEPIVIVGGGIIGASLAYHLQEDRQVILLEQNDLLGAGTTQESIAMLGLHYPSPKSFRQYSRDYYHALIDKDVINFTRNGAINIRNTPAGYEELKRTAADLERLGHDSEFLDPDDLCEFNVTPPKSVQALYIPDEGYLDPSEIIAHWIDEALTAGADVRTETQVIDIHTNQENIDTIETTSDQISAGAVINAAGPWAPQLNEMVGVSVPLRHNYGPILVLEMNEELSLPTTSFPNGQYFREEGTDRVFVGQRGRSYKEAKQLSPDDARSIPESFYLDTEKLISDSIPKLASAPIINEWLGMRTITPDGLPILGESPVDDFYFACGLSGKGVTLAPAVGKYLQELLTTPDPQIVQTVSPARFDDYAASSDIA